MINLFAFGRIEGLLLKDWFNTTLFAVYASLSNQGPFPFVHRNDIGGIIGYFLFLSLCTLYIIKEIVIHVM